MDMLEARPQPFWQKKSAIGEYNASTAEESAVLFRQVFCDGDQFGPLYSLPQVVVEEMGIPLFVIKSNAIDGASVMVQGQPFIFVSERFNARMLFSLAHEVGHVVSAPAAGGDFAVLDSDSERPASTRNVNELFAHRFASALLLPRPGFVSALARIREVSESKALAFGDIEVLLIAHVFGVSFSVAGHRFEQLGFLPKGGSAELEQTIRQRHGSPEKRAREAGLPPREHARFPTLSPALLQAAVRKIRAGEVSLGRAAAVLGVSSADLVTANASV